MESIDPANLKDVNKGFNKPGEYAAVLERLAQRNVFAITSFIFGMDNDTTGVADRTLSEIQNWPPGLPIFGLLTPLPATPLYKRLEAAGRLTRPRHWQEFIPFAMAHTPLKMTIDEAHAEVKHGWAKSYSPAMFNLRMRFVDGHLQRSMGHGKRDELLPVPGPGQAASSFQAFVERRCRKRSQQAEDGQPWRPVLNFTQ